MEKDCDPLALGVLGGVTALRIFHGLLSKKSILPSLPFPESTNTREAPALCLLTLCSGPLEEDSEISKTVSLFDEEDSSRTYDH